MAFYKICICGEKIVFERRRDCPDHCPSCGRRLVDYMICDENESHAEELTHGNASSADNETPVLFAASDSGNKPKQYSLRLSNGKEIPIPAEGGIIGRTELGAEELAEFPSVSRQHIRVTVRRNIGVLIEDISSYGTLVDGQKIVKNEPVRVAHGAKISLCNVETELQVKAVDNE